MSVGSILSPVLEVGIGVGVKAGRGVVIEVGAGKGVEAEVEAGGGVGVEASAATGSGVTPEATGAAVTARAGLSAKARVGVMGAKGVGPEGATGGGEVGSTGSISLALGPVAVVGSKVGVRVGRSKGWSRRTRVILLLSGGAVSQTRAVPTPIRAQTNKPSSRPDSGKQARNSPQRGRRRTGREILR